MEHQQFGASTDSFTKTGWWIFYHLISKKLIILNTWFLVYRYLDQGIVYQIRSKRAESTHLRATKEIHCSSSVVRRRSDWKCSVSKDLQYCSDLLDPLRRAFVDDLRCCFRKRLPFQTKLWFRTIHQNCFILDVLYHGTTNWLNLPFN